MPNLTANLVPTCLILAPLGPSWRQRRLQEASKWRSTGGLDRICGHLGAKKAPRAQPPKNSDHFPANLSKNLIFHSNYEPHGILQRIFSNPPDPPETQHPVQNRPWVPRAGGQDYGSLHTNSLKQGPLDLQLPPEWPRFWPTVDFGQPLIFANC